MYKNIKAVNSTPAENFPYDFNGSEHERTQGSVWERKSQTHTKIHNQNERMKWRKETNYTIFLYTLTAVLTLDVFEKKIYFLVRNIAKLSCFYTANGKGTTTIAIIIIMI